MNNRMKALAKIVQWTGRILGLSLILLVLVIAIGEGVPNLLRQPLAVGLQFLAIFVALVGFGLGWKWDWAGGLIGILGMSLLYIVNIASLGRLPDGLFPVFWLPAILFLVSWGMRKGFGKRQMA